LTRYYNAEGTPPGRWLGAGVAGLGGGQIVEGDQVSEAQLQLLVGMGRDPITGKPLGRAYPEYQPVAERVAERVADLDPALGPASRAEAVVAIESEETERGTRRAVAGYDFTFSIPKSASVLWAVADAGTQSLIGQAHHAAVAEMVAFMEREVAATRTGATGRDGAVAQVDVTGLIATGYDHYDSRAGDPHLHTHVVISNKVQTVLSLGIAVASSIGTKSLIVPENGYTGINLPLRPNRGGALSTRSTHPETFRRVAEILPRLNVTISNPFEWMTKGGSAAACVIHLVQYAD
jgi:hypothetical protein